MSKRVKRDQWKFEFHELGPDDVPVKAKRKEDQWYFDAVWASKTGISEWLMKQGITISVKD